MAEAILRVQTPIIKVAREETTFDISQAREVRERRWMEIVKQQMEATSLRLGRKETAGDNSPDWVIPGSELMFYRSDSEAAKGKVMVSCPGVLPATEAQKQMGFRGTPFRWMVPMDEVGVNLLGVQGMDGAAFYNEIVTRMLGPDQGRNLAVFTNGWGGNESTGASFGGLLDRGELMLSIGGLGSGDMLLGDGQNYTFDSALSQVRGVLSALKQNGVDLTEKMALLAGHSMGGWQVLRLAAELGNDLPLTKIISLNPVVSPEKGHIKLLNAWANGVMVNLLSRLPSEVYDKAIKAGDFLGIVKRVIGSFYHEKTDLLVSAIHRVTIMDGKYIKTCSRVLNGAEDLNSLVDSLKPLADRLVITWGENDRILNPDHERELAAEIGCRGYEEKHGGHYAKRAFLKLLKRDFIDKWRG